MSIFFIKLVISINYKDYLDMAWLMLKGDCSFQHGMDARLGNECRNWKKKWFLNYPEQQPV